MVVGSMKNSNNYYYYKMLIKYGKNVLNIHIMYISSFLTIIVIITKN